MSSYTITYNNLTKNQLFFKLCVCCVFAYATACMEVRRQPEGAGSLLLSVGPGIELKLSELVAAGKSSCWLEKYDLMTSLKHKEYLAIISTCKLIPRTPPKFCVVLNILLEK